MPAGLRERVWNALLRLPDDTAEADHRRFIVGGDWNTARLFDVVEDYDPPVGTSFFERCAARGWCESLRNYFPEEVRTYLKEGTRPYELDHLFTDPVLQTA